jgi:hypothetical protein
MKEIVLAKKKEDNYLDFYNPAELMIVKAALLNYRKAPFVGETEKEMIEEILKRINQDN